MLLARGLSAAPAPSLPVQWRAHDLPMQDVVYKDVIEPLESVSVSIAKTDKTSIQDYGPLSEVRPFWPCHRSLFSAFHYLRET